ncbi:MAG: hybrid sensor histidine kinase/response regulator, partial [Chloroflexota bacterium]
LKLRGRASGKRILRAHAYCLLDDEAEGHEAPSQDQPPALKNVVLLIEDITEQRRSEEALRLAQKMESLGVLAGGVAHDFNNLLVAMLGQASLALRQLAPGDPTREHLQKVVGAAQQASDLTQQMLAYSGRGHFAIQSMDLNALIEDQAELWQAAVSHRVPLQLALAPSLPLIDGDAGQLRQMILNLILNGVEARSSGRVTLRTELVETSDFSEKSDVYGESDVLHAYSQFTGRPLDPGAYVKLEVIDEATGISAHELPHIFDPFFTTKEQGRGLGLAAVLGIVRGHKAGLLVRNNRHGGATFEILFPAQAIPTRDAHTDGRAHESSQADPQGQTTPADGNGATHESLVLVIDDETHVREAVTDILLLEDIPVMAAEDGYQGIDLYRQHRTDVELVLLDLSMPGMDGEETYRRLRQIDPQVRVLLSSGYSASDIAKHFEAEGAVGFLQKPYSVTTLVDEVRRHLKEAA